MRFPQPSDNFNRKLNSRKVCDSELDSRVAKNDSRRSFPTTNRPDPVIEFEIEFCSGHRVSVPTYDGEYRVVLTFGRLRPFCF